MQDPPIARFLTGFILAFGLNITLLFQASPVGLIVIAQSLTVRIAHCSAPSDSSPLSFYP
jgi:hypothetical protein